MSDNIRDQIAWELAKTIASAENRIDNVTAGLPAKDEAREYWLRLMDQCSALLNGRATVENVISRVKMNTSQSK